MCLWNLSHLCDVTHGSPFKDLVPYPIFHGVPLSGGVTLAPAAPPALGSPDSKFDIVPMGSGCHQGLCPMGSQSALSVWWGPENPSLVLLFSRETSSPTSARFTRTGRDHTCPPPSLRRCSVPHASWVWVCKQHLQAGSCFSHLLPGF